MGQSPVIGAPGMNMSGPGMGISGPGMGMAHHQMQAANMEQMHMMARAQASGVMMSGNPNNNPNVMVANTAMGPMLVRPRAAMPGMPGAAQPQMGQAPGMSAHPMAYPMAHPMAHGGGPNAQQRPSMMAPMAQGAAP
jgi:hypothetical protein